MKRILFRFFTVLWVAALAALGLYYLLLSPRESRFDEEENRALSAAPELSAETVLGGELSRSMEDWMADHVPQRRAVIRFSQRLRDTLSLANYTDSLEILSRTDDALAGELDEAALEELADALLDEAAPSPDLTPEPTPEPAPEPSPEPTPEPSPEPTPKNPEKPPVNPDDFPDYVTVHLDYDDRSYDHYTYTKKSVLALTSVLDRLAACLPEDGTLVYTMVPQASVGNRFVNASDKRAFTSDDAALIEAVGARNVHAVSAANILGEAIREGQYVYFRTDMHWTPLGTWLVYREMAALAGLTPVEREAFDIRVETPFRGTYYRDHPTNYMVNNPDDLELLSPRFALEWRRVTAPDDYQLIPFLDENARANDRYTVYLGGPAGPWTYAQCDNGMTDNCLVVTDSFGLAFVPLVTQHYAQVHYYDPRYFSASTAGGSVKELIEKYQIKDIYVVVGDLHSYNSEFLLYQVSGQLGDR